MKNIRKILIFIFCVFVLIFLFIGKTEFSIISGIMIIMLQTEKREIK